MYLKTSERRKKRQNLFTSSNKKCSRAFTHERFSSNHRLCGKRAQFLKPRAGFGGLCRPLPASAGLCLILAVIIDNLYCRTRAGHEIFGPFEVDSITDLKNASDRRREKERKKTALAATVEVVLTVESHFNNCDQFKCWRFQTSRFE